MNKQEALEQLREHLRDAPKELRDYTLNSWWEQARDTEAPKWQNGDFLLWKDSKEYANFWEYIVSKQWNKAIEIANENNWWRLEDYSSSNPTRIIESSGYKFVISDVFREYEFLELRKAAERNAKQIKRITECIEKVADILEKLNASKSTEPKKEDNDWLNPPLKVGDRVFIFEIWVGDCRLPKYENKVYKIESFDFKGNCIYKTKNGVIFCDREGNKDKWVKIA